MKFFAVFALLTTSALAQAPTLDELRTAVKTCQTQAVSGFDPDNLASVNAGPLRTGSNYAPGFSYCDALASAYISTKRNAETLNEANNPSLKSAHDLAKRLGTQ